MKKLIALLMTLVMCFAFCACGGSDVAEDDSTSTEVTNPMTEVTEDEFVQTVNVDLEAPEGATDAKWFTYALDGQDAVLGELQFTLDGKEYSERCMVDSKTKLDEYTDEEITTLTGMNYDWTDTKAVTVKNIDGTVYSCDGQDPAAVVVWYDAVAGCFYSLSCSDVDSSADAIVDLANDIYEPLQGED